MVNIGLDLLAANLGMGLENIITLIVFLGIIIIYAKDYKLGLLLHFISMALLFVFFYTWEKAYELPLILMFVFLILLSFTLYTASKQSEKGVQLI